MNIYLSTGDLASTTLGKKHIENTVEMFRDAGYTVLYADLLPPSLTLDESQRIQSVMIDICDVVYVLASQGIDFIQQWELETAARFGKRTYREDDARYGNEMNYLAHLVDCSNKEEKSPNAYIREALRDSGLSISQFAEAVGINVSSLSELIHDKRKPRMETLRKVSAVSHVSVRKMIGR